MFGYNYIRDGFKDKLNIVGVCCTCNVRVDCLLFGVLIQSYESLPQVVDTFLVCVLTCRVMMSWREQGKAGEEAMNRREAGRGRERENGDNGYSKRNGRENEGE